MRISGSSGAPDSGAAVPLRADARLLRPGTLARPRALARPDRSRIDQSHVNATGQVRIAPTTLAAKTRLAASVDAALERTRSHLLGLQGADGSWNTPFIGGDLELGIGSIALSVLGAEDRAAEVVAHLQRSQNPDGGFALNAGDASDPSATRIVALALELIAKRDSKQRTTALAMSAKARAFADAHPPSNDTIYGLVANVLDDLLAGTEHVRGLPGLGLLSELVRGYTTGTISGLAKMFAPAVLLLYFEQARAGAWGLDTLTGLFGSLGTSELVERIVDGQDADGSWGWTELGTALALVALTKSGAHTPEAIKKGLGFINGLRHADLRAWTRGDAWDTGVVALTVQALNATADSDSAERATRAILAGQLPDGRFSFSIHGKLGDNDTTSTVLRMLSQRYANAGAAERADIGLAIHRATAGLMAFQQDNGSWGAFNRRVDRRLSLLDPPSDPTASAIHDVGSPDLTARVVRSLVAARNSGVLTLEQRQQVEAKLAHAAAYFEKVRSSDGTYWSRWTTGRIGTFAFVTPALRHLGVAASAPSLAKTRSFLLAHQNKDGGWGETIAVDRDPHRAGRGPSTVMQTAGAIIGLIGSCADRDAGNPELNMALQRGIAYLLAAEHAGMFTNDAQLYTILYGADYYDADASTTCFVAAALKLYRDFVAKGPEAAIAGSTL